MCIWMKRARLHESMEFAGIKGMLGALFCTADGRRTMPSAFELRSDGRISGGPFFPQSTEAMKPGAECTMKHGHRRRDDGRSRGSGFKCIAAAGHAAHPPNLKENHFLSVSVVMEKEQK